MATVTYGVSVSGGGLGISQSIQRTTDSAVVGGPYTIPMAKAGTITTRTSNTECVVTSAGHGLTNAAAMDVWWNGGMRYGTTVNAYDTNTLTLEAGAGDVLPANATAVAVQLQTKLTLGIDGDECDFFVAMDAHSTDTTAKCSMDFQDSGNASVKHLEIDANEPFILDIAGGATNQLTGNAITHIQVSVDSTTEDGTLNLGAWLDSTV